MILVFGRGQLGQELEQAARERGVALTVLSRAEADIAESADVAREMAIRAPSLVVNAAAYTKVDQAETEPDAAERGNVRGPALLASVCVGSRVPLVHISTDYVFDGSKAEAYTECDDVAPLGVYGRTKELGEAVIREGLAEHVILRTSWVYGAFGHNFLKTMLRLAATKDELRVVADQRGCPTSTRDLAEAILHIAPRLIAREPVWGTYHLVGTGVTTWHGFASRIVAAQAPLTDRKPKVTAITTAEYPTSARRPANSALDSTRFAETFGFRARRWEDAADATVRTLVTAEQKAAPHVA